MSGELARLLKAYDLNKDRLLADIDMRQTVTIRRSGNALAATIPKKWLRILSWKEGDTLQIRLDKSKGTVTLQKSKHQEERGGKVSTSGQKSPVSEGSPDLNPDPTISSARSIEKYRS